MSANTLTFWGHAFFEIITAPGKRILLDPWVVGNPLCPLEGIEDLNPDLVLVTHDHADHVGQAGEIVGQSNAVLIANVETAARIMRDSELPPERVLFGGYGMNIGATVEIDGIRVTQTQAFHSSSTGVATGYIIRLEDGATVYHAGDTGLFASMKVLAETHGIDTALLPIGNVFTMDSVQALKAVELIQPKLVIPMHYGTFPILTSTPDEFIAGVEKEFTQVEAMGLKPGESIEVLGKSMK